MYFVVCSFPSDTKSFSHKFHFNAFTVLEFTLLHLFSIKTRSFVFFFGRSLTAFNFNMLSYPISLHIHREYGFIQCLFVRFFFSSTFIAFSILSHIFLYLFVFLSKRFSLASQRNCVQILSSHSHHDVFFSVAFFIHEIQFRFLFISYNAETFLLPPCVFFSCYNTCITSHI